MESWHDFFIAQVGASAALTGLIFVSVSISLPKIISLPHLPVRAFQALVVLLEILVISSIALVPDQSLLILGAEVLVIAIAVWSMVLVFDIGTLRGAGAAYRRRALSRMVLSQLAAFLYVIAGGVIVSQGSIGVYFLVPAIIFSYGIALIDAWVLLVEINR